MKRAKKWNVTKDKLPKAGRTVEIITEDGEQFLAVMRCDDVWQAPRCNPDLFNSNVVVWRYSKVCE